MFGMLWIFVSFLMRKVSSMHVVVVCLFLVCSGSMFVLSCKCLMLVASVQPVAIRNVVFVLFVVLVLVFMCNWYYMLRAISACVAIWSERIIFV